MDELFLIFPTKEMEAEAEAFVAEHFQHGEHLIHGDGGLDSAASYDEWLDVITNNLDKNKVEQGRVAATTYFVCRRSDGKIVGMIDIRHELNEYLSTRGGRIGYGVRPTERRNGYATKMLSFALRECKKLGIDKVLIICDKENIASRATILKNGGLLEAEIAEASGTIFQRYWIERSR